MKIVYLGLGSNLGDRQAQLESALELLEREEVRVLIASSLWETEPAEYLDQPWFLNMAVKAETDLMPLTLLQKIQKIEAALGRERRIAKGPRTIDIDILLFNRFVIDSKQLTVPHPGLAQRRFVLEPLAEIEPELRHPVLNKTVRELLAAAPAQIVRRWKPD